MSWWEGGGGGGGGGEMTKDLQGGGGRNDRRSSEDYEGTIFSSMKDKKEKNTSPTLLLQTGLGKGKKETMH